MGLKNSLLIFIITLYFLNLTVAQGFAGRRKSCPKLSLRNGRVRNRPRIFAQFICNQGFYLMGERYAKCQDGIWDNPVPICVRPSCKVPKTLENGLIDTTFNKAVLRFFCSPNYELQGPRYTYCDGKAWNAYLPSCVRTDTTPSISCDFETIDICGWSHDLNHDFAWERLSNSTPSRHVGTGPAYDHTKGPDASGYYMYIESSYSNENDVARLISPIYPKQSMTKTCLEFYYHMYGSGIGKLKVYLQLVRNSWSFNESNVVFTIAGNQGDLWHRGFIELGVIEEDFLIVFEGVRGISYVSDIAIDDVQLIKDCNVIVTTAVTDIVDMATTVYESCENRCFKILNETLPSSVLACDCDENCQERNSCCPDFSVYCIIEYTTDTSDDTTSADTTVQDTTLNTQLPTMKTTNNPTTKTTDKLSTKITDVPNIPTTSKPTTWYPQYKSTSVILPRQTTIKYSSTFTMSPSIETTPRSTTTTTKKLTTQTISKSTNYLTTSTKKEYLKTGKTIRFYDDGVTDITDITNQFSTKGYLDKHQNDSDELTKPSTAVPNNSLTVKVVIISSMVMFVVLVAIFVLRKVPLRRCLHMKKMRNSNGDSQSDVRFLTSDEILDFTLATPRNTRDY